MACEQGGYVRGRQARQQLTTGGVHSGLFTHAALPAWLQPRAAEREGHTGSVLAAGRQ